MVDELGMALWPLPEISETEKKSRQLMGKESPEIFAGAREPRFQGMLVSTGKIPAAEIEATLEVPAAATSLRRRRGPMWFH